ncbi:MAG: NfeD family protein [Planctomycetaceae bacterium]
MHRSLPDGAVREALHCFAAASIFGEDHILRRVTVSLAVTRLFSFAVLLNLAADLSAGCPNSIADLLVIVCCVQSIGRRNRSSAVFLIGLGDTHMDPVLIALCGLLIGLALLVLEFFIPSGGLIFVLACISLVVGTWGAWHAWGADQFWLFGTYLAAMFVLAPASVIGGLYLLDTTSLGDRVLLEGPKPDEVAGFGDEVQKLREMIGQRGETMGLLNPGGMVIVDGNRYHCESPGMMIQPGTEVEVFDVESNRLVVRVPISDETSQDTTVAVTENGEADQPEGESLEPFDFDLPGAS